MEAKLTELNKNEILKYLGYNGQKIDDELDAQIERCIAEVMAAAKPRLIWKELKLAGADGHEADATRAGSAEAGGPGFDTKLLENCTGAIAFAATIGSEVERLIMQREVTNAADALILDACASAAVENLCSNFEEDWRTKVEAEGMYLTDRFSPGYEDIPMDAQKTLFGLLDVTRKIGVSLTDTMLMVPRKSVTAVMGISTVPVKRRPLACENCPAFIGCTIRKTGKNCRGEAV